VLRSRDEWLAGLVLLGLTLMAYRMAEKPLLRLRSFAVYGIAWGVLQYIQPSTIAVLPVHLGVLLAARKGMRPVTRLCCAALTALMVLLVVLPWTVRNRSVMGSWMFMRDNLGLELLLSNGERSQASEVENLANSWFCSVHPMCYPPSAREIVDSGEVAFNRRCLRVSLAWMERNPASFARLTLRRIAYFWTDLPWSPVTFAVRSAVTVAGLIGLILMWKRGLRLQVQMLSAFWLTYPAVYYLVQYSNRYVLPVYFASLLPAGFTMHRLRQAAFGRSRDANGPGPEPAVRPSLPAQL
jgi:hypothetical protein